MERVAVRNLSGVVVGSLVLGAFAPAALLLVFDVKEGGPLPAYRYLREKPLFNWLLFEDGSSHVRGLFKDLQINL